MFVAWLGALWSFKLSTKASGIGHCGTPDVRLSSLGPHCTAIATNQSSCLRFINV